MTLALAASAGGGISIAPSASSAIQQAAQKYGVPVGILTGVYGAESSFGQAYSPGETTYGYFGLTSPGLWNPGMTFAEDADTSARVLSTLYHKTGNWNSALLEYSGNSYGLAHVQALAAQAGANIPNAPSTAGPGTASASSSGSSASSWEKLLLDIVFVGAGLAMVYRGAKHSLGAGRAA